MIESDQDTEVYIDGKEGFDVWFERYLGLTNHPKVKEAAIEANSQVWHGLCRVAFPQRYARHPRRA